MSDHSRPIWPAASSLPVEFFSHGERKETTEDMTPDGFISLVENGPCIQNGLHIFERALNHPELCLYLSATFLGDKRVLDLRTHMPSYLASSSTFCMSMETLPLSIFTNFR